MKNNLKYMGLVTLLVVVIVFGALCSIDLKNMEEGKPVLFSTWGKNYTHVGEIDANNIRKTINDYVVYTQEINKKSHSEKWFSADKTFMISKSDDIYIAYCWIYAASYINKYNGELLESGSLSQPCKFEIKKTDGIFEVVDMSFPRDGEQYAEDLKTIFPEKILNDILKVEKNGDIDILQIDIQNQIAEIHN